MLTFKSAKTLTGVSATEACEQFVLVAFLNVVTICSHQLLSPNDTLVHYDASD